MQSDLTGNLTGDLTGRAPGDVVSFREEGRVEDGRSSRVAFQNLGAVAAHDQHLMTTNHGPNRTLHHMISILLPHFMPLFLVHIIVDNIGGFFRRALFNGMETLPRRISATLFPNISGERRSIWRLFFSLFY